MLVWSRSGRFVVWLIAALLIGIIFIAPLAVIVAASLARQWNGVLPTASPSNITPPPGAALGIPCSRASSQGLSRAFSRFFADPGRRWLCALKGRRGAEVWACSSSSRAPCRRCRWAGLLVAFSQRPLLLNGTTAIVILAHFVLISAFSFGNVSAGLARLTPEYEEVASSRGAPDLPALQGDPADDRALSHRRLRLELRVFDGELGATVMATPPAWVTLPVAIFGLTDRGDIFSGAALTMILVAATLALLIGLERFPLGAVGRRA